LFLSKAGACLYNEQVTPLILSYPVQAVDSTAADDTFKSYFGGVEDCNDLQDVRFDTLQVFWMPIQS
jgi:hypothetical protein